MNLFHLHGPSHEPSAPRQGRLSRIRIWTGLFGAPAAWIAQMSISEPLAAYACYPYQAPLSASIWAELPAILAAVGIMCFTGALLSGLIAWSSWRYYERQPVEEEASIISKGKDRNRFIAMLGALSSFIFIAAIVFNICAVWLVSPCSSWL